MCGLQDRRRKEADGAKGECGRRRRTASEGDEDVTLKRFKGTGEVEPNGQTDCASVTTDCESLVIRLAAAVMLETRNVVGGRTPLLGKVQLTALLTTLLLCRTIPAAGPLVSLRRTATPR